MTVEQKTIERLRMECEAARGAYTSASHAFGARLRAGETPHADEWLAEETARTALVAAQQALRAALLASDALPPPVPREVDEVDPP